MRKERNCRYGNEKTAPQAVGSTLTKRVQIRKEVHRAGGNNTKNDCPCNQDIQTDRKCSPEGNEDCIWSIRSIKSLPTGKYR